MRLFLTAVAVLFLSLPTFAQTQNHPFKPSPFKSKATLPSTAPQLQRAVIVFAPGERANMPNQDTGYHIFVGDQGYHAAGMGPKSAGIYDVEVFPDVTNLIIVHVEHPGGPVHGKPLDETFRLRVISPYSNVSNPPTETVVETVDGRRLIVYSQSLDAHGNTEFTAVVQATKTTPEIGLIFSAYGQGLLTPGIYDFKFSTVEKQNYVDVLIPPKPQSANHGRSSAMWIRYGLVSTASAQ